MIMGLTTTPLKSPDENVMNILEGSGTRKCMISKVMQGLFNDYTPRVLNTNYYPTTSVDTLNARITAIHLLQSHDAAEKAAGAAFISKTSITNPMEDLARLQKFAANITVWHSLEVCDSGERMEGTERFLEYKLSIETEEIGFQIVHCCAYYENNGTDAPCGFLTQVAVV